jgi:very-short-patch-repair endonuclease
MEHKDAVGLVRGLAEAQHGVVARRQLLAAGLDAERIRRWREGGRLVGLRRGVYALGHGLLTVEGRWMAAVLACGDGALLSHGSAAALWGLRPSGGAAIHVTVAADGCRRPEEGIRVHRSALAAEAFATTERGVPVTTVAWTLLDFAAVARAPVLRRAVEEADRRELLDVDAVACAMSASPRRAGSAALRRVLDDMAAHGITRTRSDVEAAFLELCLDHQLPRPEVNRYDNGVEVDFRWPAHRLIVEVDGWAYHRGRIAFSADRARDRRALAAGWRVARFTALEVLRAPRTVVGELGRLLDQRRARVE